MATTPETPAYLPLATRRQAVTVTGNYTPDTSGFAAYTSATGRFLEGLEKFNDSLVGVFKTYHGIRERRDIRDTDTMADEIFRQRKMDVFASRQGKGADGILDDEHEWQQKTREDFVKKSGLSAEMAGDIWDSKAKPYLDRVGAYMLEQNMVAEKESKFAAAVNAQNELALSNVGDFGAYAAYSSKITNMYGAVSKDGIKMKEAGIDVMIESWVAQSPNATVQWFNKNKDQLRQVMGREFADVSRAMDKAERSLTAQVQRAELQAQRQQRLADQAQKRADNEYLSQGLTALASDDPNFNVNAFIKEGQQKGISGQALMTILKATRTEENIDVKKLQGEAESLYYTKAAAGELTKEDETRMQELVANGRMTASTYTKISETRQRVTKLEEKGLTPAYKMAVTQLRNAMAPRGGFDPVNPKATYKFQQTEAALFNYVNSLGTPEMKFKALDLTNPDSYVNQLIRGNMDKRSPADRMMDLTSPTGDVLGWQPALPDTGKPVVEPRREGESFKAYNERLKQGSK